LKKNIDNENINKLCEKCLNKCKQQKTVTLVSCPSFVPKPKQLFFKFKYNKLNENERK